MIVVSIQRKLCIPLHVCLYFILGNTCYHIYKRGKGHDYRPRSNEKALWVIKVKHDKIAFAPHFIDHKKQTWGLLNILNVVNMSIYKSSVCMSQQFIKYYVYNTWSRCFICFSFSLCIIPRRNRWVCFFLCTHCNCNQYLEPYYHITIYPHRHITTYTHI